MVSVSQTRSREMTRAGERAYPYECVGALFGKRDLDGLQITEVMPIDNKSREDRRTRFRVTDRDYLLCERYGQESGLDLLGFYHSHPDHPAKPSATDLRYAHPHFLYIIISIQRAEYHAPMCCFLLNDDGDALQYEPMRVFED